MPKEVLELLVCASTVQNNRKLDINISTTKYAYNKIPRQAFYRIVNMTQICMKGSMKKDHFGNIMLKEVLELLGVQVQNNRK